MYLVREVMFCKPGKVRPMVQKFLAMSKAGKKMGFSSMRVMTDVSAEHYWTVVAEFEMETLEQFSEMTHKGMQDKELQEIMKDYHDLVMSGRREIYMIEK